MICGLDERVHLGDDARRLALRARASVSRSIALEQPLVQRERRLQQLLQLASRVPRPGELHEDLVHVLADRLGRR